MSTPVRGADGPLDYTPRWARTTGSGRGDTASDTRVRGSAPVQELPQDLRPPRIAMPPPETSPWDAASPDAPLESSGGASDEPAPHRDTKLSRTRLTPHNSAPEPTWKRKKRAAVFEGDAALRELRSRLASAPDQTPEPPLYQTRTPISRRWCDSWVSWCWPRPERSASCGLPDLAGRRRRLPARRVAGMLRLPLIGGLTLLHRGPLRSKTLRPQMRSPAAVHHLR